MITKIRIINQLESFSIGTEGFDLIIEIIAMSQPKWVFSFEKGFQKSTENLKKLKEI